MEPVSEKLLTEIKNYCVSEFPKEACGFIILVKGKYRWIPCPNASDTPSTEFAIDTKDYASAEDTGEIAYIVHSHPPGVEPAPSQYDIESQQRYGITWLILDFTECSTGRVVYINNSAVTQALYGRKYVWHVNDCYSFIRDWYKEEHAIVLPDFYRKEKFWEYGEELYLDNFEKAGFSPVPKSSVQRGDVILMCLANQIVSHGAIYLGGNTIAHHLPGRLSSKDVYGQEYMKRTKLIVRHKCLEQ